VEWDGWEEGLVESILGPEDQEDEWFQDSEELVSSPGMSESSDGGDDVGSGPGIVISTTISMTRRKLKLPRSLLAKEKAKVQMLDTTGDECEGRGGELGRRLEAWLHVSEGDHVFRNRADEVEVGDDVEY
jgi:hypothetical protein